MGSAMQRWPGKCLLLHPRHDLVDVALLNDDLLETRGANHCLSWSGDRLVVSIFLSVEEIVQECLTSALQIAGPRTTDAERVPGSRT